MASYNETADENNLIDSIIANAPSYLFDSRHYFWKNYKENIVGYDKKHFQHVIELDEVFSHCEVPRYVCSFDESLLITWIGLKCTVHRYMETATELKINVVEGVNPYTDNHCTLLHYCKVPPPINRFEPAFVHSIRTRDKLDIGNKSHMRVHNGYSIELVQTFDNYRGSSLSDVHVVVKLQHPSRVGGTHDHASWNKNSRIHSYNIKEIASYSNYNKYVLKGDNVLYYK